MNPDPNTLLSIGFFHFGLMPLGWTDDQIADQIHPPYFRS